MLIINRVSDAAANVLFQHLLRYLVRRGRDRLNLGHDIETIAPLFDHALHTADLALDASQTREQGVLVVAEMLVIGRDRLDFGDLFVHSFHPSLIPARGITTKLYTPG